MKEPRSKMKKLLIYIIFSFMTICLSAQETESIKMNTQPWKKGFMEGLDIGGYYRFIFSDRSYKNPYDTYGAVRQISVIDPTYYDPMLFLYVGGSPTANSSFGAELRIDNYMVGASKIHYL